MPPSDIARIYKGVIEDVIRNVRNDFVNMGVDEQVLYDLQQLWEQKLMDYKVVTPAEYFSNGDSMPQNAHAASYAHLQMMQQGAPVAYPFHPAEVYGLQAGQPIRPPQPNGPTATYFHPSQGYFEANAGNAANLPTATAYPTPIGQVSLQRRPATGRPVLNPNQQPGSNDQAPQQNPKRFDGAGDEEEDKDAGSGQEEERSPDEIIQLLFTNKEKEAEAEAVNSAAATENPDDLINSELDDDDDDEDNDDDDENEEAGTMDENVVLCQYEKVARTRNKWRCVFKSGLIHVNGVDYSFSRANGEFEW